ncbi:hypothetical protein OF897_15590 [Chryseobacterium formosus]|uniref:DoxX family protein n=1 Tax=Chryseobacterium formosus TaxID=1537363 RepID=A0ABT3XUJ1_9FLAO|nr:hypothetical protein [Chryseobacterium formosus]MCX8525341.1 hypothetical protein [Chryseobacterium formosus]
MVDCKSNITRNFAVFFGVFCLQFILFFPLSFLSDFQLKISQFVFGDFTQFLLDIIFNKRNNRIDYSSDSCSMLILMIVLLITSAIFSFLIKKRWTKRFLLITEYVCVIYISIILIKYGIDKIFKTQFPEPESNILFTRFGNLDKDILFWSTIGTSKIYNIITGSIEIFSGILLLLKRSQFLGLLLAIVCFSQILIINISFDISVKLFSLILLLMNIFLLRKNGWELILKIISLPKKTFLDQTSTLPYKIFLKILILGIVLVKIGMPYFNKEENKNSVQLTGVYEITSHESPYKYLFFHKDQYLIFMEKSSEKMTAFHYDISFDNQIILEDYQHNISKHLLVKDEKDSTIVFSFNHQMIHAKPINYKKMNAMQDRFHVLVD